MGPRELIVDFQRILPTRFRFSAEFTLLGAHSITRLTCSVHDEINGNRHYRRVTPKYLQLPAVSIE